MDSVENLKQNRDQILAIASRHGAHDVRVFGSIARGEDRPESDVDLLVKRNTGLGVHKKTARKGGASRSGVLDLLILGRSGEQIRSHL